MTHFASSPGIAIGSILTDSSERMEIRYHDEEKRMSARFEDSSPEWIAEGDGAENEEQSREWMRLLYRGREWNLIELEAVANG